MVMVGLKFVMTCKIVMTICTSSRRGVPRVVSLVLLSSVQTCTALCVKSDSSVYLVMVVGGVEVTCPECMSTDVGYTGEDDSLLAHIPWRWNMGGKLSAAICAQIIRGRVVVSRDKKFAVLGGEGVAMAIHCFKGYLGAPDWWTPAHIQSLDKEFIVTSSSWGVAMVLACMDDDHFYVTGVSWSKQWIACPGCMDKAQSECTERSNVGDKLSILARDEGPVVIGSSPVRELVMSVFGIKGDSAACPDLVKVLQLSWWIFSLAGGLDALLSQCTSRTEPGEIEQEIEQEIGQK